MKNTIHKTPNSFVANSIEFNKCFKHLLYLLYITYSTHNLPLHTFN